MLIVCVEQARVEFELVGGVLSCPSCRGMLRPWGCARERVVRGSGGDLVLVPRRAKCRGCEGTHVLLPDLALLRRRDEVAVIGAAIEAKVAGGGTGGSLGGWGCRRTRCVAGCGGSLSALSGSGRISRGGRSCSIRRSGRCCRPAAGSRTRWRRLRSPRGRGCCGSVRVIRGGSRACCRGAGCCATRVPSFGERDELRRSRAREQSAGRPHE